MLSALTIIKSSFKQFLELAAISIFAYLGSTGRAAMSRPSEVNLLSPETALSSVSSLKPSLIDFVSGLSTNGKSKTSPRSKDSILKMTAAKFVRVISGSV